MPFSSKTAAEAGRKGSRGKGRWSDKDPSTYRTKTISVRLSEEELEMINAKAAESGMSRNEFIVRAAYVF